MYGDFFLLERDDEPAIRAERLAFGETSGRNEAWLRDTLFERPELLPIGDIDSSFGPLIPLCTELRTEAGPLDIAFINPHGQLTLVECKLWRNPEARRKVVAQVLDYARAISRWTYSDLQRQVAATTKQRGNVPFDLVKKLYPDLPEHKFVDDAYASMRAGRFLLLIVGDGIREDVGAIAELINRNAASGFSFGLVEVALYGLDDGGLIVQPRTIAKSKIIERSVVIVRDGSQTEALQLDDEGQEPSVSARSGNNLGESPKQTEYREWWTPVLESEFDDPDQEPAKLYWPNNVRVHMPAPKTWILAYRAGGEKGQVGVCMAGSGQAYTNMMSPLIEQKDEILAELPADSEFRKFLKGDNYTFSTTRSAADFDNDDAKRRWFSETLNTYVNAFRPRLKQYE
ncbi:MAG: hypothetical protein R8K50_05155 [Mariprofundus sp.]